MKLSIAAVLVAIGSANGNLATRELMAVQKEMSHARELQDVTSSAMACYASGPCKGTTRGLSGCTAVASIFSLDEVCKSLVTNTSQVLAPDVASGGQSLNAFAMIVNSSAVDEDMTLEVCTALVGDHMTTSCLRKIPFQLMLETMILQAESTCVDMNSLIFGAINQPKNETDFVGTANTSETQLTILDQVAGESLAMFASLNATDLAMVTSEIGIRMGDFVASGLGFMNAELDEEVIGTLAAGYLSTAIGTFLYLSPFNDTDLMGNFLGIIMSMGNATLDGPYKVGAGTRMIEIDPTAGAYFASVFAGATYNESDLVTAVITAVRSVNWTAATELDAMIVAYASGEVDVMNTTDVDSWVGEQSYNTSLGEAGNQCSLYATAIRTSLTRGALIGADLTNFQTLVQALAPKFVSLTKLQTYMEAINLVADSAEVQMALGLGSGCALATYNVTENADPSIANDQSCQLLSVLRSTLGQQVIGAYSAGTLDLTLANEISDSMVTLHDRCAAIDLDIGVIPAYTSIDMPTAAPAASPTALEEISGAHSTVFAAFTFTLVLLLV